MDGCKPWFGWSIHPAEQEVYDELQKKQDREWSKLFFNKTELKTMKRETVQKAQELIEAIDQLKKNIKNVKYTQHDNVIEREMELRVWQDNRVTVPVSLFKMIGKLILAENQEELRKLEDELEKL